MKTSLPQIFGVFCCSCVLATAAPPVVDLIEPQSFMRGKGGPIVESYSFNIPEAGPATLAIENGSGSTKVSSARVWLNGVEVLTPASFNQNRSYLELPVTLLAGDNLLQVELRSKPGSSLTAFIAAPADSINLLPIAEPLVKDLDPLVCQVVVSALGVPATGVSVGFSISGFEGVASQIAQTDASGIATVTFGPFAVAGLGIATAQVEGAAPALVDSEAFEVVQPVSTPRALTLTSSDPSLNLAVGSSGQVSYTLNLSGVAGQSTHVTFTQQVLPNFGGLTVANNAPGSGWTTTANSQWEVTSTLNALLPGIYIVQTTATIVETSQTASSEVIVMVTGFGPPILFGAQP